MPALDGLAGIVLGGVFGSIFVVTCIISAIKAVRDRRVIKRRIAAKEQEKLKNGVTGKHTDSSIEEVLPSSSYTAQKNRGGGEKTASSPGHKNGSFERLDLSVYSIDRGVDNATFKHSFTDIKHTNDKLMSNLSSTADKVPSYQKSASKRTRPYDPRIRDKNIDHLPPDCLAVKKIMRSNSYELAVAENSWLPVDMSNYSTSKTTKTFRYSDTSRKDAKSTNICFDNKAYDKNDLKRT